MSNMLGRIFICACLAASAVSWSQTGRPFLMGSSAIRAVPENGGIVFRNHSPAFTFDQLAPDVDVINIQPEFLGVPFANFAKSSQLADDDPWAKEMTGVAEAAKSTGKPLLVQIALTRGVMVANTVYPHGVLVIDPNWAPACADLTDPKYGTVPQAYVNYALWVARTFTPKYFVIMLEPNIYFASCGRKTPSWQVIVKTELAAYNAVKKEFQEMLIFPSFNLEFLYGLSNYLGQDPNGFDDEQYLALLAMKRDRLGLVSFPQLLGNPYTMPLDYLTRILDRNPNEPRIVMTETGWSSTGIRFAESTTGQCLGRHSEESLAEAYMHFLFLSAYLMNFDLVVWWTSRDEFPSGVVDSCFPKSAPPDYTECKDDVWCRAVNASRAFPPPGGTPEYAELSLKAFGTLGIRDYEGAPKQALMSMWRRFLDLPHTANWNEGAGTARKSAGSPRRER